jgi:hypothetical protein
MIRDDASEINVTSNMLTLTRGPTRRSNKVIGKQIRKVKTVAMADMRKVRFNDLTVRDFCTVFLYWNVDSPICGWSSPDQACKLSCAMLANGTA